MKLHYLDGAFVLFPADAASAMAFAGSVVTAIPDEQMDIIPVDDDPDGLRL